MRIAFFSNYLSHHQIPFSEEMFKLMGDNYTFISCEPFSKSRKQMGWEQGEKKVYELRPYESETDYLKAKELAANSDIMVWGSAKYEFVQMRIKSGKINLRYSERLFKKGFLSSIKTLDLLRQMKFNFKTRANEEYLLCASAYSPFDFFYSRGKFRKTYKWGYYPQTMYYNQECLMNKKSDSSEISILWAGRMIELKHPELVISLAENLRNRGIKFSMKIIGSGVLKSKIEESISSKQLSNQVVLLGAMSPEKVREYMESSDFFLFTSDFNEGWGAVLNESMNSGCVVFCSDEIGAAHYLINDGVNGYLFKRNQIETLSEKVINLVDKPQKRKEIGINAYETIVNLWSAKIAAKRLYEWCESAVKGELISFDEGPMSIAKMTLPNGSWWFR